MLHPKGIITSSPIPSDANDFVSDRPYWMRRKSSLPALKFAAVCVCIAAFISLGVYGIQLLRVVSVLGLRGRTPAVVVAFDRIFGSHTTVSDLTIPGTLGPVQLRVYTPIGIKNPPPIVLIHGFVLRGNQDDHTNQVAMRLASMGFLVTMPTVPGESRFEMRASDLPVIRDAVRWTANTTNQRVALFGVSFGGGLVIPAAAPTQIANDVKLIFSMSGYNNLDSIGHYYIHDQVTDPDGKPYVGIPPTPGPMMIVSPYLKEMLPPDQAALLEPVIERSLAGDSLQDLQLDPLVSREMDELRTANTPQIRELYRAILVHHHDEIASISPASVLGNFKTPLYVLHGSNDSMLPEGEVEWMRREVAGNNNVHFMVSPWVSHARVGERTSYWQKFRVLSFSANMLWHASRRDYL